MNFELPWSAGLVIDFNAWRYTLFVRAHLPTAWWNAALAGKETVSQSVPQVPLTILLAGACISKAIVPLFCQLVWQLARHVELAIRHSLGKGKLNQNSLLTAPGNLGDITDRVDLLDQQLLRYVESGRGVTRDGWHLSDCHDRGILSGLQIQLGALFVSNVGIVRCSVAA